MNNPNKKKNILLITPDAVGGTLLKNLTFFYSQFNNEIPLVDANHLELGISVNHEKTKFRQDPNNIVHTQPWEEVIDLLESVNLPTIAKFSYYNLSKRNDTASFDEFAEFLNKHFYIILCDRKHLFEHALSWSINYITGSLNVFDHNKKINTFTGFYTNKICIDPHIIEKYLNNYVEYKKWCDKYFKVDSVYYYEDQLETIEDYVLSLPIFDDSKKISWHDKFGITFNDWNYCHYQMSNITDIFLQKNNYFLNLSSLYNFKKNEEFIDQQIEICTENILNVYKIAAGTDWPELNSVIDLEKLPNEFIEELKSINFDYYVNEYNHFVNLKKEKYTLPIKALENENEIRNINVDVDIEKIISQSKFLNFYKKNYHEASNWISLQCDLHNRNPIPIKKQTLFDKKQIIENFNECLLTYNKWAELNNFLTVDENIIEDFIKKENKYWNRK